MTDSEKIICAFGGVSHLCKVCGLPYQTVYSWKRRGIPTGWRLFLKMRSPGKFKNIENETKS